MTEVTFKSDMTVELIDMMGSEQRIVQAARVSTKGARAEESEATGLVRFLVREGHTSPLEHCVFTFRLHVPIFVQNQLVRHRIASFNIESGRYKELEPVFHLPAQDRPVKQVGKTGEYQFTDDALAWEANNQLTARNSEEAWGYYEELRRFGVAKEVARAVLPVNIYSTLYLTVNLHSALNIIRLRTERYGSHPQYEIAEVGEQIRAIVGEHYPNVLGAWEA